MDPGLTGCIDLEKDDDFSGDYSVKITKLGLDVLDYLSAWKPVINSIDQEKPKGLGTDK